MTYKETLDRVIDIFNEVFEGQTIDENTTAEDIEEWDSLKQIELMVACEQEFDVHFTMKEIISALSVKKMIQLLLEKKGNK